MDIYRLISSTLDVMIDIPESQFDTSLNDLGLHPRSQFYEKAKIEKFHLLGRGGGGGGWRVTNFSIDVDKI